jgi:(R,R)-butanediol dehydrogenase/meso-butanediol dehydrogenase/diacetyl reductase
MRTAAYYRGNRRFEVKAAPSVPPGPGEVQVAVAYTGLCGTDLHILHGDMDSRLTTPAVIGHEMSGTVTETGPGAGDWTAGDAVTVMPLRWCGTCPACLAGHQHICQRLNFVGIDSDGSLQSRWNVPASLLVRLPPSLSLQHAALAEPTAVAVHDVRRASLRLGERALVVGGGPVGLLIALTARSAGADVVIAEIDPFRRTVAGSLGLTTVDPATADVAAFIGDWTSGSGADVAFEVSGSQPGADAALASLAVRGRLVVVGIHPVPRALSLHHVFWRELTITGARVYQRRDFETALSLLAAGQVPADTIISRVLRLADVDAAFGALESGGQVMKVLLDCQPEVTA